MSPQQEVIKVLRRELPHLKENYGVKEMGIFGSFVRGEATEESDLDILIEFEGSISLLKFVELENYLSELLEVKVDLVMKDALRPRIGKHILEEVVYCDISF